MFSALSPEIHHQLQVVLLTPFSQGTPVAAADLLKRGSSFSA